MDTLIGQLFLTFAIASASIVTGRLLVGVWNIDLLKRPTPESLAVSIFIGTGFLGLAFGWGSHAGLGGRLCLSLILCSLLGMALYLARHQRLTSSLEIGLLKPHSLFLLLILAVYTTINMLPIGVGQCYWYVSDTMFYTSAAEWLSDYGFGCAVPGDVLQPSAWMNESMKSVHHRMGSIFLLALVKAAAGDYPAIILYPAVMAWGAALGFAGIFVLCRWGLRVSRPIALVGTMNMAVLYNSLTHSATFGFFSQVYGTACLAYCLAIVSRCFSRARWTRGNAILLGLAVSIQLSHYGEMAPITGVSLICCAVFLAFRSKRNGTFPQYGRFLAASLASVLVLANIECYRVVRAILFMVEQPVGYPHAWTLWQRFSFAMGGWGPLTPAHGAYGPVAAIISFVCLSCFLIGFGLFVFRMRTFGRSRTLAIGAASTVFLALTVYYGFITVDPWMGTMGHSYRLTKVCMWAFPLIAAFQISGLARVLKPIRQERLIGGALCILVVVVSLPFQLKSAKAVVKSMHGDFATPSCTLSDISRFRKRIRELNPQGIYVLRDSCNFDDIGWKGYCSPHFLYPIPFLNSWLGGPAFGAPFADPIVPPVDSETVFIHFGNPPFAEPLERLPFNYSIVDCTRPLIFQIHAPNGIEAYDGGRFTWVGNEAVRLQVYCPRAGSYKLSFDAWPGPSLKPSAPRTIRVATANLPGQDATFQVDRHSRIGVSITLPEGLSEITVHGTDHPTGKSADNARTMLFALAQATILPPGSTRDYKALPENSGLVARDVNR